MEGHLSGLPYPLCELQREALSTFPPGAFQPLSKYSKISNTSEASAVTCCVIGLACAGHHKQRERSAIPLFEFVLTAPRARREAEMTKADDKADVGVYASRRRSRYRRWRALNRIFPAEPPFQHLRNWVKNTLMFAISRDRHEIFFTCWGKRCVGVAAPGQSRRRGQ